MVAVWTVIRASVPRAEGSVVPHLYALSQEVNAMLEHDAGLVIDCNACAMRDTDACRDCVVSYLLDRPEGGVVFDAAEERAIRAMGRAGLLPLVRFRPKEEAG